MTDNKALSEFIITLPNVRLAFPALFEAKSVEGTDDPAFSASFLLDPVKNAAAIKKVQEIAKKVAQAKWGQKADAILRSIDASNKNVLKDGNLKAEYAGYAGNMFISARSKTRPQIIDANRVPLGMADGRPYAGCYVYASVEIWAQDNKYGKRINATLRWVQFFRDGDAFAGGTPVSEEEYQDLSDTGESDAGAGASYA